MDGRPEGRDPSQERRALQKRPRSGPGREGNRAITAGPWPPGEGGRIRPTFPEPFRPSRRPTLTRAREKCDGREGRAAARRSVRIRARRVAPAGRLNLGGRIAESIRFPSDGFTYSLTLFSKFFSSFPHGTCSLSVSRRYLALDGVYHPFWAAIPNNPTLGKRIVDGRPRHRRGCHPLRRAVPSNLGAAGPARRRFSQLQVAGAGAGDFKFERFPLHSPLLGESLLVSFPPLINMLKFSGWPRPI